MTKYLNLFILSFLMVGCHSTKTTEDNENHTAENLILEKVANHVYQHTSFLESESFGKVPCNGMIVFDGNEAIIFDTPPDHATSLELIHWVENELNCKIKAIIPTHFHVDCLGGLEAFHQHQIPSYAHHLTIQLAQANGAPLPTNGFDKLLELTVGTKKVMAEFFGEGHTRDNVVGYFPDEEIVFGGCLIKELNAGKGNLADANVNDWPATVATLKERYPNIKVVIPGHGKPGGTELLDYTMQLFEQK